MQIQVFDFICWGTWLLTDVELYVAPAGCRTYCCHSRYSGTFKVFQNMLENIWLHYVVAVPQRVDFPTLQEFGCIHKFLCHCPHIFHVISCALMPMCGLCLFVCP